MWPAESISWHLGVYVSLGTGPLVEDGATGKVGEQRNVVRTSSLTSPLTLPPLPAGRFTGTYLCSAFSPEPFQRVRLWKKFACHVFL